MSERVHALLTRSETERAARITDDRGCHAFLAKRLLARIAIATELDVAPRDVAFTVDEEGKLPRPHTPDKHSGRT